jgi:hypothetical protein
MKKIIIIYLIILGIGQSGFSQSPYKFESLKRMECYKGLSGSAVNMGLHNGTYSWGYRIKNNYKVPVQISCRLLVGGEEYAGGGYDVTNFLNPGETYCQSSNLFTALLFNNSSTKYRIEIKDVCFNKEGCYKSGFAECDNGSPNQPKEKNENLNDPKSTSSEISSTFSSLIEKYNDLCNEASNSTSNSAKNAFSSNCNKETTLLETPNNISVLKSRISNLENALKNSKTEEDKEEKAKAKAQKQAEEEAARKQKAEDDKREQYNTAIQNGDSAMDSKQFSSAMSYYSNAKSYAQTSSETAEADRKYKEAFEAKKTAERTERVAKVQADDLVKDAQYAGLTASFVGLAAFLKDSYSPKWYAMKFQLGLGLESFPLISNNVNQYHWDQTYIESFTVPTFHIGLKSGFFNNKGISAEINPQFNLGFSALSPGKSGGYVEYGSTGTLYFGNKGYSIFKVFVEGGYFKRSGTFKYDYDAANAKSDGTLTTNSDDVREGIFSHGKIKYGAGIQLRWINDEGKETFIRPTVYYEKASFFEPDTKPVLNMNLQVNILSEIIIELTYVKNYYIPGEVKYPSTLTKENMNFWGIKLIRQGKLF